MTNDGHLQIGIALAECPLARLFSGAVNRVFLHLQAELRASCAFAQLHRAAPRRAPEHA